jgi:hypothetical protein
MIEWLFQYALPLVAFGVCWWPCCSGSTCNIASDDFGRANGTDITTGSSCGWTETAGSWSLASGALTTTSANAIALCGTSHTSQLVKVTASLSVSNSSDQPVIIVTYLDSSNFNYVKFTSTAMQIFRCLSGTHTQLKTVAITRSTSTVYTPTVCVFAAGSETRIQAKFGAVGLVASVTAYGNAVALGTRTMSGTVTFDDFSVVANDGSCPACVDPTCTITTPFSEIAVYHNYSLTSDDCDCSDYGGETSFIYNPSPENLACVWTGCAGPILATTAGLGTCGSGWMNVFLAFGNLISGSRTATLDTSVGRTSSNPCLGEAQGSGGIEYRLTGTAAYWSSWAIGDTRIFPYDAGFFSECLSPSGSETVEVTPTA